MSEHIRACPGQFQQPVRRSIWYYVNLNSEPPRAAFVHPCDDTRQPLSAPSLGLPQIRSSQTPIGSRQSTTGGPTVAQQLYASSLSSSHQASTSSTSLWTDGTTSGDPSPVSRASPSLASFPSSRPRHMADNGPQLANTIAPFTANAFYHHSVGTPFLYIPPTSSAEDVLETNLRPTSLTPSVPEKDHYSKPCFNAQSPPLPRAHSAVPSSSVASYFPNSNLYTATTEDNLMVIPTRTPAQAPNWMTPIDVSCLSDSQPMPLDRFHGAKNISTLNNENIVQPKPTRPLNGVSLNLQAQVAGDMSLPESVKPVKAKKGVSLKNFGLGTSRNLFSKGKAVANTLRDGETSCSPDSDKDESFVFVEILQLGTT